MTLRNKISLQVWLLALLIVLPLMASGCKKKTNSTPAPVDKGLRSTCVPAPYAAAAPYTYTTATPLPQAPLTTGYDYVTVDIPVDSVGIGIVLAGTNANLKFIEHGVLMIPSTDCMKSPAGVVPFAFNQMDLNGDTYVDDEYSSLSNYQAPAVFFPNNGQQLILPKGRYTFPVGSVNAAETATESDTLTATVYYMTPSAVVPTLKVNLWLVAGVNTMIDNDPNPALAMSSDPELQGALNKLIATYRDNANVGISVVVNYQHIPDSTYATLDTVTEINTLVKSFPTAPSPNDAINLFVVASIGNQSAPNPIAPAGVIGYSLGVPGPFTQQGTVVSGVLAEYQHDGRGDHLGTILTHELGHYFGLYHTTQTNEKQTGYIGYDPISDTTVCKTTPLTTCADKDNLMFPVAMGITPLQITVEQGRVLRLNPVMK
ncbi:MAG: hypothetical protein OEW39_08525 [Deltaproteobacteria bacterium]|nr:hypothetical protein [Deltaproteobacteria bacterium]